MRLFGWFVIVGFLFVSSCKDSEEGLRPEKHPDEAANRWIYERMCEEYLYNTYSRTITPSYNQSAESFFATLLSTRSTDEDGKMNSDGSGRYFYSTISRTSSTKRSRAVSGEYTYGIVSVYYGGLTNRSRILYVEPNSVAAHSGLQRGDWITQIDGADLSQASVREKLKGGGPLTLTVGQRDLLPSTSGVDWVRPPYEVALPAATILAASPVLYSTLYDYGSARVAYLVYTRFMTGPGGFTDKTYNELLKATFRNFKEQGATSLILDLRYNGGGYLECGVLLSSLIAPRTCLGTLLAKGHYNPEMEAKRGAVLHSYLPESQIAPYNLNLRKLYVLVDRFTASASEFVINSLLPDVEIVLVGERTEGKRVASYEITSPAGKDYGVTLQPITMRIFNRHGVADYANGFMPHLQIDELSLITPLLPLGDPEELLLAIALERASNGASLQGPPRNPNAPNAPNTSSTMYSPQRRTLRASSAPASQPVFDPSLSRSVQEITPPSTPGLILSPSMI